MNRLTNFFLNNKNDITVCAVLCAVLGLSSYALFWKIGIYGDDWGASTFLYAHSIGDAVKMWWHAGSGEIENFRLLAVIIPTLWYYTFRLFGLAGIILLNYVCYSAIAILFYFILKRHAAPPVAALGALLFAIYPTNNAYLWQVTMSYALAMLLTLAAVLFFYKNKYWQALLVLIMGLLINEAVFFVFILALLPPNLQKFSWPEFKPKFFRWLIITFAPLVIYAVFRVLLELKGVTGGSRAANALGHVHIFSYLLQFATAIGVDLVISFGVILWKLWHYANFLNVLIALITFIACFFLAGPLFLPNNKKNTKPLYLLLAGVVLICAGRYYGFYYVPSINTLNLDSRYYYASSLGGAVFFAGLFEWSLIYLTNKKRFIPIIIICLMISASAASRFAVMRDYAAGWDGAKKLWQEFVLKMPKLSGQEVIIVSVPPRSVDQPVGVSESMGDLRHLVPLFYGQENLGISNLAIQKISTSNQTTCFTSEPFYFNTCVDKTRVVNFLWNGKELVQTSGELLKNPSAQPVKVPSAIRQILNLPL